MAPTRTPTKKTVKRPQKAKKESIEFHHLASRLLGKGPPKQRSAALITPTKSSSKRAGAQLNCSAKSFSPSVSLTPAKPRKLFFSFDLCSRTYQGMYTYTEFMEQAKIFLQHKYYFLPKELITARAKSMWNKRMEEVMSQKAAGGSGNANCKSEALARKQQQQQQQQPKPTTASLPRRKNFVDESCEADNEDEVEEMKEEEEEEETVVIFSKPTTPAPRYNRPRRPKESLTTFIEEIIDDSPMEQEEEQEEQAKENEDESTVIYFSTDSARDASAEDASIEDASVEDASAEDASVEDASVEDASVEDASVEDASAEDASAEDSSAEVASPAAAADDDNNNNNPKINVLLSEPVIVDLGPALSESSSLSTHS